MKVVELKIFCICKKNIFNIESHTSIITSKCSEFKQEMKAVKSNGMKLSVEWYEWCLMQTYTQHRIYFWDCFNSLLIRAFRKSTVTVFFSFSNFRCALNMKKWIFNWLTIFFFLYISAWKTERKDNSSSSIGNEVILCHHCEFILSKLSMKK